MSRKLAVLLIIGAIISTPILADAATPPAIFKGSDGNVYVHSGVRAGDKVSVELIGRPLVKKLRAGHCGQISLNPSNSVPNLGNSVKINGTTINLTTIATSSKPPKCTSNTFTPPTTSFKTGAGKVVLVGYKPGTTYSVQFNDVPLKFSTTVNACNFATIRHTTVRPLTASIKVNGSSYTVASLAVAAPPLCRKSSSGTVTKYTPATW